MEEDAESRILYQMWHTLVNQVVSPSTFGDVDHLSIAFTVERRVSGKNLYTNQATPIV